MYHRPPVHNPPHAYEYLQSCQLWACYLILRLERKGLLQEGQYDHYMNCYTHIRGLRGHDLCGHDLRAHDLHAHDLHAHDLHAHEQGMYH
jgi:hypothetical protein